MTDNALSTPVALSTVRSLDPEGARLRGELTEIRRKRAGPPLVFGFVAAEVTP